jgi:hypothetical protein
LFLGRGLDLVTSSQPWCIYLLHLYAIYCKGSYLWIQVKSRGYGLVSQEGVAPLPPHTHTPEPLKQQQQQQQQQQTTDNRAVV